MKAAYIGHYGSPDVIEFKEMPKPDIKHNQVLVQVIASSVTTADWRLRAAAFPGILWLPGRLMMGLFSPKNKIPGMDFAGRVVAVGRDVTEFKMGDRVFGLAQHSAHAEFLVVENEGCIALMPENVDFYQAAAVPFAGLSALVFLRDFAEVKPGQRVLINGASGGVGVYMVQLAKHFGAHVTGVCSSANIDLVKSIGADRVIDYTVDDFTKGEARYDHILDTIGKTHFQSCKKVLEPGGTFIPLELGLREIRDAICPFGKAGRKIKIGVSGDNKEDLTILRDLLEQGAINPVIDTRYPFSQIAEAHRKVESRHKVGSVIIDIAIT